jgi:hypothetical protein
LGSIWAVQNLNCRPKRKEEGEGEEIVKTKEERKNVKKCTYVYTGNTDKDCDLLQDTPVLPSGRTPHDKQNRNCLEYSQNLVMSPTGAQRQLQSDSDWLNDCYLFKKDSTPWH